MQAVLLCKTDTCSPSCGWLRPETPRTPRRSTWLVLLSRQLGTFARKLASLKQYGLVRRTKYAVPSQFSDSFYHCGAAIGNLLIGIYKVACLPFDNGVHINKSLHKPRADNIRLYMMMMLIYNIKIVCLTRLHLFHPTFPSESKAYLLHGIRIYSKQQKPSRKNAAWLSLFSLTVLRAPPTGGYFFYSRQMPCALNASTVSCDQVEA